MTHIAIALGLRNRITHLTPWCGYDLINIDHCLNSILVRHEGSCEYNIVILSNMVHPFTLLNPDRTSIHDRDNWHYPLEILDESLTQPAPEYHPTHTSASSSSSDDSPPLGKHRTKLQTIQTYITTLWTKLTTLRRNFMSYTDVMVEQMDHIYQEIYTIRRFLWPDMEHIGG